MTFENLVCWWACFACFAQERAREAAVKAQTFEAKAFAKICAECEA